MKQRITYCLLVGLAIMGTSLITLGETSSAEREALLRERLSNIGYSDEQIDVMIGNKKAQMEQIKAQCEAQGLSQEECRAQFASQRQGQGGRPGMGGNREQRHQMRQYCQSNPSDAKCIEMKARHEERRAYCQSNPNDEKCQRRGRGPRGPKGPRGFGNQ